MDKFQSCASTFDGDLDFATFFSVDFDIILTEITKLIFFLIHYSENTYIHMTQCTNLHTYIAEKQKTRKS